MTFLVLGTIVHVFVLPFLDLTLIAVNAVVGIVFTVLLSMTVLGEELVPKYDISGLICICIGCTGIVVFANKEEQDFTSAETIALMRNWRTIILVISSMTLFFANHLVILKLNNKLRDFEQNVESFEKRTTGPIDFSGLADEEQLTSGRIKILPDREKITRSEVKEALISQNEFMERPERVLIDIVNACPDDLM